jgi:hypothetical protein
MPNIFYGNLNTDPTVNLKRASQPYVGSHPRTFREFELFTGDLGRLKSSLSRLLSVVPEESSNRRIDKDNTGSKGCYPKVFPLYGGMLLITGSVLLYKGLYGIYFGSQNLRDFLILLTSWPLCSIGFGFLLLWLTC